MSRTLRPDRFYSRQSDACRVPNRPGPDLRGFSPAGIVARAERESRVQSRVLKIMCFERRCLHVEHLGFDPIKLVALRAKESAHADQPRTRSGTFVADHRTRPHVARAGRPSVRRTACGCRGQHPARSDEHLRHQGGPNGPRRAQPDDRGVHEIRRGASLRPARCTRAPSRARCARARSTGRGSAGSCTA